MESVTIDNLLKPSFLHELAETARDEANKYPTGSEDRIKWAKLSLELVNKAIKMEESEASNKN